MRPLSIQEAREVYNTYLVDDFPRNERKPFSTIERTMCSGQYMCIGYDGKRNDVSDDEDTLSFDVSDILAYSFFVVNENSYLFDYFAVRRDLRGTGIGSAFLQRLSEEVLRDACCILLEIENPEMAVGKEREVCERRRSFYFRNGLIDTGVEARTFGVEYRILEVPLNGQHSREEVKEVYRSIYRSYLSHILFSKMIKIRAGSDPQKRGLTP